MADPRHALGTRGESLALAHLQSAGLEIITANWRCPVGEMDIVAREHAPDYAAGIADAVWLVFVEVRTRRGAYRGAARDSVARRKQARLRHVAETYISQHAWAGPWRIDVIAVEFHANRPPHIEHIRHAVIDES